MKNVKTADTLQQTLFHALDTISEYHTELKPSRHDNDDRLLELYFYWVDKYNDGYDPRHIERPEWLKEE